MPSAAYSALSTGDDHYPPPRPSGLPPWRVYKRRSRSFFSKRIVFYGAAVLTGLSLHLILVGSYIFKTSSSIKHLSQIESAVDSTPSRPGAYIPTGDYIRHGLGQLVSSGETRDLEDLRTMVSRTKGYFTRDYSVWLGWNNVRVSTSLSSRYGARTSYMLHLDALYHRDGCITRPSPPANPRTS